MGGCRAYGSCTETKEIDMIDRDGKEMYPKFIIVGVSAYFELKYYIKMKRSRFSPWRYVKGYCGLKESFNERQLSEVITMLRMEKNL